ncbi:hypothetical protein [Massilia soli]|uniref:Phosphoribosyltransferase n=1 Tax=Massilia soli TaxID=2792854 RepID=A0ABS7SN07_9BURK|nr:hypothetical protein [Massilia soli]MBZ2206535.1 hypothetical protein [Massilia soli]
MPPHLLKIDPSNIGDHHYLGPEHECFFFYEYAARQGYAFSEGNQLVSNIKKSVLRRGQPEYRYKERAIASAGNLLHRVLSAAAPLLPTTTVVPIPPSKVRSDPEFDDRVNRIALLGCANTAAETRELVMQTVSYVASHTQQSGEGKKPHELEAIYELVGPPPRQIVILVDDVLTTGAHFVAARSTILRQYPDRRVVGMFLARRVLPNPFEDFDAL